MSQPSKPDTQKEVRALLAAALAEREACDLARRSGAGVTANRKTWRRGWARVGDRPADLFPSRRAR